MLLRFLLQCEELIQASRVVDTEATYLIHDTDVFVLTRCLFLVNHFRYYRSFVDHFKNLDTYFVPFLSKADHVRSVTGLVIEEGNTVNHVN